MWAFTPESKYSRSGCGSKSNYQAPNLKIKWKEIIFSWSLQHLQFSWLTTVFKIIVLSYVLNFLCLNFYHQITNISTSLVFRHGFCFYTEGSFILKAGSHIGNRIQSITERMAVIEGKNKVWFPGADNLSVWQHVWKRHCKMLSR